MNLIKIILLNDNVGEFFPDIIPPVLLYGDRASIRTGGIIEKLEEESRKCILPAEYDLTVKQQVARYPGQIIKLSMMPDLYFYFDSRLDRYFCYKLREVDIDKPWTILRNESNTEYIHYFKDGERFKIINKELMYCE